MAYRWINRFLKGDDSPVTEPDLPKIEGKDLRAFPDDLPFDELNTKIDEVFVPLATKSLPKTATELTSWREGKMAELRRSVFHLPQEQGTAIRSASGSGWLAVLDDTDTDSKPEWLAKVVGAASVYAIPPTRLQDPAPYYIRRSLPLLGQTVDSMRLADVIRSIREGEHPREPLKVTGRGQAGIIAAYTALFRSNVSEVVLVDPPTSHRDGPIFLNIVRVMDIPEGLGLLAPRPLTIYTSRREAFAETERIYAIAGGALKFKTLQ